ncbi:hypothetical protein AK88_04178 [Plasmodium fragile]|uniref:Plasmodium RESA N-terminal domain-containing protein n=1 Tax=Plasmodium fragile TaxID=5857 RepID=A0A0D9QHE5_PLAFR|nr:uncharacterized protein AK88_04178 [Plasmodium fragile]KJP86207.1 hypothetical protein AK88_04178 [Plasmodium fragile]
MNEEGHRRGRGMGRVLGEVYTMQERVRSKVNMEEMENERAWEESNYMSSEWDDMDERFNQMWMREKWMSRGKYRPRSSYDICPYGCTDADLIEELSEDDINKRLEGLGSQVSVRDMFILWSNVHRLERKKYIKMQERAKLFCDDLVRGFHIPEEVRMEVWMRVHRCMTSLFLRFEKRHHKHFYMFLNRGPSARIRFLSYINRTRNVWNMRRLKIDNYWRKKMVKVFLRYKNRFLNGAYSGTAAPGAGVRRYGRVGYGEYDSTGSSEEDISYADRYDSSNVIVGDRRDSTMYGSADSNLYASGDSVMCERGNECLGESRIDSLFDSTYSGLDASRIGGLFDSTYSGVDASTTDSLFNSTQSGLSGSRIDASYDSTQSGLDAREGKEYSSAFPPGDKTLLLLYMLIRSSVIFEHLKLIDLVLFVLFVHTLDEVSTEMCE